MPRVVNSALNAEAAVPTSYTIDSIILENHSGRKIDINGIVTDFTVTESIYRQWVSLTLNVRDTNNIMEEFEICGQEKITISVSRIDLDKKDKVKVEHEFYVTEYPVYARSSSRFQVYTMRAISAHAYNAKFMKISRAMEGSSIDLIKTILVEDLKIPASKIVTGLERYKARNISVIVPNLDPLDAIQWILRRTFDQHSAPFYCYETFGGVIRIISQSELVSPDNSIVRNYTDDKFFSAEQQTSEDYKQRLERLISITSDIRLSKFVAGAAGAFASTSRYLDLPRKTYIEETFDYTDEFSKMIWMDTAGKKVLDPAFYVGSDIRGLNKKPEARHFNISIDGLTSNSYHDQSRSNDLARAVSYMENFDTVIHDVVVSGDLTMKSGLAVQLKLSKPIDPQVEVVNAKSSTIQNYDTLLSGKHIITSLVHRFDTDYRMDVRLKRDSLNRELTS